MHFRPIRLVHVVLRERMVCLEKFIEISVGLARESDYDYDRCRQKWSSLTVSCLVGVYVFDTLPNRVPALI